MSALTFPDADIQTVDAATASLDSGVAAASAVPGGTSSQAQAAADGTAAGTHIRQPSCLLKIQSQVLMVIVAGIKCQITEHHRR